MEITVIDDLDFGSSNVYVVNGTTLIDTGCDERGLLERLRENGIRKESVKLIVNTHCHFDHTSCNHLFTKAKACMHSTEADAIGRLGNLVTMSASNRKINVDLRINDGDKIEVSKAQSMDVIHTPGHTAGSICLLLGDLLFSGDTLFPGAVGGRFGLGPRPLNPGNTIFLGAVGRTDLPTGNQSDLEKSIGKLAAIPFRIIYPGHGPSAEKSEVFEATH